MMKNRLFLVSVLTFLMVTFNSCGSSEDTNWGIDHEKPNQETTSSISIPSCNGDKTTTTNAIKVYEKQEIKQLSSNTKIRIWHYQNGDKLVCTISGKAVIYDTK